MKDFHTRIMNDFPGSWRCPGGDNHIYLCLDNACELYEFFVFVDGFGDIFYYPSNAGKPKLILEENLKDTIKKEMRLRNFR